MVQVYREEVPAGVGRDPSLTRRGPRARGAALGRGRGHVDKWHGGNLLGGVIRNVEMSIYGVHDNITDTGCHIHFLSYATRLLLADWFCHSHL